MKIRIALNLLFIFLMSCGIEDGRPNGVFIRVENNSDVNFTDVIVQSGNVENGFGMISARSSSAYKEFEYAFKFASIWLKAENQGFSLIPNDYTGEIPLRSGYYTYRVGLSSGNLTDANLVFEFVRD